MNDKRPVSTAEKTLIFILSLFCLGLIVLSVADNALPDQVRRITSVITVPSQKGISQLGKTFSAFTGNLSDVSDLRAENKALQERVDTLTAENSQLVLDKEELARLQSLLNLADEYSDYDTIGAHVIAKDSGNWFSSFTIDKGTNDGIQVNCNVIAGSGLVGIVTSVGRNWAVVRSIIDDDSNVSAMVSNTSDTCIIAGSLELIDTGSLNLVKLTDADNKVHVGDKVVTSNISEHFLPGLLIGYISKLDNDANNLTKSGEITPVVDFRHLQEVLVIRTLKEYVPVTGKDEEAADSANDTTSSVGMITAPRDSSDEAAQSGSDEAAGDNAEESSAQ